MQRIAAWAQRHRERRRHGLVLAVAGVAFAVLFAGVASATTAQKSENVTLTVNIIPISNTLPLDIGIKQGFFAAQGIDVKKVTLQSGNDIVLALANNQGQIGFAGWVPAMIARTQGIPITAVATSEVEGTGVADNWQNVMVKGSSSIQTPADLAGKTIAVNALKGVGEVMIKAALEKSGVDPNSIKLLAVPFPTMRSALANGQVDAAWAAEPFMSQMLSDGARIVMAPGPVLGRYFPIGGYFARSEWVAQNPESGEEVPDGDEPVADVLADPLGRGAGAAPGGEPERPAADLDDARRPSAAPRPRALREEVRRHHQPAQPDPARAELDLGWLDSAGDGGRQLHHAPAGRQGRRRRSRRASTPSSSPTAPRRRTSPSSGPA